jgi:antibiotic biosynthesis monooxygenase (ABM) superfamily enzyme
MTGPATAVSLYHRIGCRDDFLGRCGELDTSARAAPGFVIGVMGAPEAAVLDWATSVTFENEQLLHRWLDSEGRSRLLARAAAAGFPRSSPDLILTDGSQPATGVGIFKHTVSPGQDDQFCTSQLELIELSSAFSGFEGAAMLGPDEASEESVSILRFRTDHQLQAWMNSTERRDALPHLRSQLAEDFTVITHSTPFGSILRVQDGTTAVTPNWKTAMLVLLVLYPTVMTLSRFLGPALTQVGAQEWLAMWLSQIVSVGLMTWFLMPVVTGWFRRWLDPVDGAGWRVSLIGAGVVVVVYVATLTLFASVQWLQFWDYPG